MPTELHPAIPILRFFSEEKAREFYIDFLGFAIDWEHRFEPDLPLYLQIRRSNTILHLSEHSGDGTPGTKVYIRCTGIVEWQKELIAKRYKYLRPGLQEAPWGDIVMYLTDPFGNELRIGETIRKKTE